MRTKIRWLVVLALLAACFACSCGSKVVRPANVPADAVFVLGAKVGWWQECTASVGGQPVHCRIWNQGGLILEDEAFLPYDGGAPPKAQDLKIDPNPPFSGPDRIYLTNGRILLPESRYNELKRFVDGLEGKPVQPE